MSERTSHTLRGDAPLSAAKNPNVAVLDEDAAQDSELIGRTVTINRPRQALYDFWRDFRNLPRVMENIESVTIIDDYRSHWVVSAPAGKTVEWDSIVVEDIPGERIAWRSTDNSQIAHSGNIEFRDALGNRGTHVTATIIYDPPAGSVGAALAKLFQKEPKIQSRRDLRRFKQLMETGEIATAQINASRPDSH